MGTKSVADQKWMRIVTPKGNKIMLATSGDIMHKDPATIFQKLREENIPTYNLISKDSCDKTRIYTAIYNLTFNRQIDRTEFEQKFEEASLAANHFFLVISESYESTCWIEDARGCFGIDVHGRNVRISTTYLCPVDKKIVIISPICVGQMIESFGPRTIDCQTDIVSPVKHLPHLLRKVT